RGRSVVPFKPKPAGVKDTLAALEAVAHLDPDREMPCWLDGRQEPAPAHLVSFPNGVLDLATGTFDPPNPLLFTTAALSFDYEEDAPEPTEWLKFLDAIFAGERDQIDTLQEIMGYLLTADVEQEKAL